MSTAPTPLINPPKPGWQTTEFWQTIILQGLAFATILGLVSPSESAGLGSGLASMVQNVVALIIAGGTVVHYITSRTKIKSGGA